MGVEVMWGAWGKGVHRNMGAFGEDMGIRATGCKSRVLLRRRQSVR